MKKIHSLLKVTGLFINNQVMKRLPRNIKNFFPNLIAIAIHSSQLENVSFEDLNAFPNLIQFVSLQNIVETVEEDLFAGNPLMEAIDFSYNPVNYVHHNAFNHLSHLKWLKLQRTRCINGMVENSRSKVVNLISQIHHQCPPPPATTTSRPLPPQPTTTRQELQTTTFIPPPPTRTPAPNLDPCVHHPDGVSSTQIFNLKVFVPCVFNFRLFYVIQHQSIVSFSAGEGNPLLVTVTSE